MAGVLLILITLPFAFAIIQGIGDAIEEATLDPQLKARREEGLAVVVFKNDGTWDFEELEFDEDVVKWVRENIVNQMQLSLLIAVY